MSCTSSSCNQSGFMHPACSVKVEDILIRHLSSSKFAENNTNTRQLLKRMNLKSARDRESLWRREWTDQGLYGLIAKLVKCPCGRGFLCKDLDWPPTAKAPRREGKARESNLPSLNTGKGGNAISSKFNRGEEKLGDDT